MSELSKQVREEYTFESEDDHGTVVDPNVIALCDQLEELEEENAILADAYDIKSVPCSKCGAETGSLGRRITYLISQNNAFRKQLAEGR